MKEFRLRYRDGSPTVSSFSHGLLFSVSTSDAMLRGIDTSWEERRSFDLSDKSLRQLIDVLDQEGIGEDGASAHSSLGFDFEADLELPPSLRHSELHTPGEEEEEDYARYQHGEEPPLEEELAQLRDRLASYESRKRTSLPRERERVVETSSELYERSPPSPQRVQQQDNWTRRDTDLEILAAKRAVLEEKEEQLRQLRGTLNEELARVKEDFDKRLIEKDAEITSLRKEEYSAATLLADILGESRDTPLLLLVQNVADRISAHEERIENQAAQLQDKDRLVHEMRREQSVIVEKRAQEIESELKRGYEEKLIRQRQQVLQEAELKFDSELDNIRKDHDQQIDDLRRTIETLETERRHSLGLTPQELEIRYPEQLASFKSLWEADWISRFEDARRAEEEREAMFQQQIASLRTEEDLVKIVEATKQECATACSAAVRRLREHCAELESRLKDQVIRRQEELLGENKVGFDRFRRHAR